jgi:PhoH-like ATPase
MRKIYVLDTSVLICNPSAYKQFPHSDVILPISVLNELDKLKKLSSEAGKNARVAIRLLDEISNLGDISTGILLDDDIMLSVDATYLDCSQSPYLGLGDPNYGDTQILACAYSHWQRHPQHDVCLVSNDINLRIKAKSRGIEAEAQEDKKYSVSDVYSGLQVIINEEAGLDLQRHGHLDPIRYGLTLNPHECVLFRADNGDGIALGRKVAGNKVKIVKKCYPWGIAARNVEQTFLIDLIMDKEIDLITTLGLAGSGKSLIALAASLELVLSKREYERLIIYRPIESVGKSLGFLPGELSEKLSPHFTAIMDNFEILFSNKVGSDWRRDLEMYQKKGRIEMDAIAFIRGRSIPNSLILVDESQNLNNAEIKTILTRAGENTKVIFNGDTSQIDADNLDASNNGLTYIINKFKTSDLAAHITLTKGERSRLATLAAEIL